MIFITAFAVRAQTPGWQSVAGNTTTGDKVGIGTTGPEAELHVATQSAAYPNGLLVQQSANTSNSPFLVLRKSRGTIASPLTALQGDGLGAIVAEGYDGSSFMRTGSSIRFVAMNVGAGAIPTDLAFNTGTSGTGLERMRITNDGRVGIGAPSPDAFFHVRGTTSQWMLVQRGEKRMFINANYYGANVYSQIANVGTDNMGLSLSSRDGNPEYLYVSTSGNVGMGTLSPVAKLHVVGDAHFSGTVTGGNIKAKYQDVAEWVPASAEMAAGTVVVLDPRAANRVMPSSRAYDTTVAGVVSAQPGLILGEEDESKEMIATTGRVKVRVDATRGAIRIGDLLVTGAIPGTAMRSESVEMAGVPMHRPGTILGKALEPLDRGEGEILVLLSMQ